MARLGVLLIVIALILIVLGLATGAAGIVFWIGVGAVILGIILAVLDRNRSL